MPLKPLTPFQRHSKLALLNQSWFVVKSYKTAEGGWRKRKNAPSREVKRVKPIPWHIHSIAWQNKACVTLKRPLTVQKIILFVYIPTTRRMTKTFAPMTRILTDSESTYWSTSDDTDSLGIFNITPIPRLRNITRSDVNCSLSSNGSLIGFRKANATANNPEQIEARPTYALLSRPIRMIPHVNTSFLVTSTSSQYHASSL